MMAGGHLGCRMTEGSVRQHPRCLLAATILIWVKADDKDTKILLNLGYCV